MAMDMGGRWYNLYRWYLVKRDGSASVRVFVIAETLEEAARKGQEELLQIEELMDFKRIRLADIKHDMLPVQLPAGVAFVALDEEVYEDVVDALEGAQEFVDTQDWATSPWTERGR